MRKENILINALAVFLVFFLVIVPLAFAQIDSHDGEFDCNDAQDDYAGSIENIRQDPLFINPANSDFHLKCNSHRIDLGDPSSDRFKEPEPDPENCRANIGAYGNTPEATVQCDCIIEIKNPTSEDTYNQSTTFLKGIVTPDSVSNVRWENRRNQFGTDPILVASGTVPVVEGSWQINDLIMDSCGNNYNITIIANDKGYTCSDSLIIDIPPCSVTGLINNNSIN